MRSLAIVWFAASVIVAPVLLLTSVIGVVWSGTTRRSIRRRESTRTFALLGGLGLLLLAGLPVWMTVYAQ